MGYVIERVTPEIQEKILEDASYDKKRVNNLLARGGYFSNTFELTWAVDKEEGSYIFLAPPLPITVNKRYFFYFKKHLYLLIIDSKMTDGKFLSMGHFDESINVDIQEELEGRVREAYLQYGCYGRGQEYSEPLDLVINYGEGK